MNNKENIIIKSYINEQSVKILNVNFLSSFFNEMDGKLY